MKRSYFKQKPRKTMKRSPLRMRGVSDSSVLKEQGQAVLRQVVIARDGGCILREYPETGKCGPRKANGELVLQAEHLNSRSHAVSFLDSRLAVCLCQRHHIYWKPQNSARYWEIVEGEIGPKRWELFKKVRDDYRAHKVDLKLELINLKNELKELTK